METVRISVMGPSKSGKSALVLQLIQNHFVEEHESTIEDIYRRVLPVDETSKLIEVLDTPGQEEYSALWDQQIRGAQGLMMVYSVDTRESLTKLNDMDLINKMKSNDCEIPMILIGNKCDLEEERVISKEEGETYAKKLGAQFIETSAKTRTNLQEAFVNLVRNIERVNRKTAK